MSSPVRAGPSRFGPARVLAAGLFAAVGSVAVWQGFGLAGYGTDWHLARALPVLAALLAAGLLLAWRGLWRVVKAAAPAAGFGLAAYAWWEAPSGDIQTPVSLREAAVQRDGFRERLAIATPEEAERSNGQRDVKRLVGQYPSLCADLPGRVEEWAAAVTAEVASRYGRLAPDDYPGATALLGSARALAEAHPNAAEKLEQAREGWIAAALRARTDELANVPPADWDGFNGTAFGRRVLVENLPATRDPLARAEADWVERSAAAALASPGGARRAAWSTAYQSLLTLKSLDDGADRFRGPRERLFRTALDDAKARSAAHLEAGEYDLAAGIAAAHEIAWANHAQGLGPDEHAAVTQFRDTYSVLAALAARRPDPSDVPPPRPKP